MEERFECYTEKFKALSGPDGTKYNSYLDVAKILAQTINFQSFSSIEDLDRRIGDFAQSENMTDKFGFTNSLHAKLAIDYFIEQTNPQGEEKKNLEKLSVDLGKMYLADRSINLETIVHSMKNWVDSNTPKDDIHETHALYQSFYAMLSLVEPWRETLPYFTSIALSPQLTKTTKQRAELLENLKGKISAISPHNVAASTPDVTDPQPIDSFIKTIEAQINDLERVNLDLQATSRMQSPEDSARALLAALQENNTRSPPLYFVDFIAVPENQRKLETFLNTLPADFNARKTDYEQKISPALTPSMTNTVLAVGSYVAYYIPNALKAIAAPYAPETPDSQAKKALEALLTDYLAIPKPLSNDVPSYQAAIEQNTRALSVLSEVLDIAKRVGGINKKISEIQADIVGHENLKRDLSTEQSDLDDIRLEAAHVQRQIQEQSQGFLSSIKQFFKRLFGISDPLAQTLKAYQGQIETKQETIKTYEASVRKFEAQCSGYKAIIKKLDGLADDVKERVTRALDEAPPEPAITGPAPGSSSGCSPV